jgi:8-oxo-dGTP pyrophosphatase MutT (NUDIX family)
MHIEIFDNGIEKNDVKDVPHRTACRGIVEKDGKYLVTRLSKYDIHMFPGGGIEDGEEPQDTVVREVLEETGVKIKVREETIRITEYFMDSMWTNIYFLCDFVEDTKKASLTQEEQELGLESLWLSQEEYFDILENNMTKHKNGPNIHNREFLGFINSLKG